MERYRVFVGDGMEELARRVLPQDRCTDQNVARCLELMRAGVRHSLGLENAPL